MAATPSTMAPLGTKAPPFTLPNHGQGAKTVSLADFRNAKALLVIFMCNHCPFVKHVRGEIAKLARHEQPRGLAVVGINSNDAEKHPDDSPARMEEEVRIAGYTFPYLFDESQEVAKAYGAACTPDFFLFNGRHELVYRGQLDDSRPSNGVAVTGADLRKAIDDVLAGRPLAEEQKPSIGCNIKWKPGNEPEYA